MAGFTIRGFCLVAVLTVLSSCGGSGGTPSTPLTLPPSGLSYPSPRTFVVGQSILPLTPTVSGTITSYAVNPGLPAGLSLDASTGVIAGTPTVPGGAATYTVSALNSGGSAATSLSITINDVAPAIAYPAATLALTSGVPVAGLMPVNTGGTATAWSISPALPPGLDFGTDGSITGNPTAASPLTAYAVRAENSGGVSMADLTIAVESGVLLDLGHASEIKLLRRAGSRVLSLDADGHWVLWNATAAALAQGDATCSSCEPRADLAGPTFVVRMTDGFHLHDAADGRLVASLDASPSWWNLATDGSYLAAGDASGLTVWSSSGSVLLSSVGDYSNARAFAAPNELRVAAGPEGADVIERIAVPSGAKTVSQSFAPQQFHAWFVDGARFLTRVSNTVFVYSSAGVQEDVRALPTDLSVASLTGQGEWFWTYHHTAGTLDVYAVGASANPSASYTFGASTTIVPSGETIGVLHYGDAEITVIDLSSGSPTRADHAIPIAYSSAYTATSSSEWLVGNRHGVVVDPANAPNSRLFGFGTAWSIAGSSSRIVVATASGRIVYFDVDSKAEEGRIDFSSSQVLISDDGAVLAAAANELDSQYQPDRSVKIFELPTEVEVASFPYTVGSPPWPLDISLAGSGQTLGKVLFTGGSTFDREVATIGGSQIWTDTVNPDHPFVIGLAREVPIRLSADGSLIAAADGPRTSSVGTNIFKNGPTLVSAVPGWAVGWIDDDRLLVNKYVLRGLSALTFTYDGSSIVSASGQMLSSIVFAAEPESLQPVSPDTIYVPERNAIYSLTTGAATWTSASSNKGNGAVAGRYIVFASGATVRAEPYLE